MKNTFLVIILSIVGPAYAACVKPSVATTRTDKFFHTLFARGARCGEPQKSWVFSNRLSTSGVITPVRINLADGEVVDVPLSDRTPIRGVTTPAEFGSRRVSMALGVDSVPSPDCSQIYTHVFDGNGSPSLRVSTQSPTGEMSNRGDVQASGFEPYDYPSPARRGGKNMVLYRDGSQGLYLQQITATDSGMRGGTRTRVCESITGLAAGINDGTASLPFVSDDAGMIGAEVGGQMRILRVRWDRPTSSGSVPCELVRTLPATTGKLAFSPDNTKVVFHSDELQNLGASAAPSGGYNSFIMNVATGNTMQLTSATGDETSEFPSFMANGQVVVRTSNATTNLTTFQVLNVPSTADLDACFTGSRARRVLQPDSAR